MENKATSFKHEIIELIITIVSAVCIAFFIQYFIVSICVVEGQSMHPNFNTAQRVIVNKVLYHFRDPKPGEVLVFHVPEEGHDLIKRVIAVAGDTVQVDGDHVYVNGKLIEETYLKEAIEQAHKQGQNYNDRSYASFKIPAGHIFVMGDNRSNSKDSRMLGPIDLKKIMGRVEVIFWPLKDMKIVGVK